MQKLVVEFKNTSRNDSQVPCSVSRALNREETLSMPHIVLTNNNSEEDLLSGKRGQDLRFPVVNMQPQLIYDSARNIEQVEIPAGLDWIKILFMLYNFKICEVGQFLPPLKGVGIFA